MASLLDMDDQHCLLCNREGQAGTVCQYCGGNIMQFGYIRSDENETVRPFQLEPEPELTMKAGIYYFNCTRCYKLWPKTQNAQIYCVLCSKSVRARDLYHNNPAWRASQLESQRKWRVKKKLEKLSNNGGDSATANN